MKFENKCKRKGKRVLLALEEKNLAKELEENDKKFDISLNRSKRERKREKERERECVFENFLKSKWNT